MRHWVSNMSRMWKYMGGTVLLVGLVTYAVLDPSESILFPKCPFYVLTSLKCPGCGSQRAIHALLNGDIPGAFHFNALLVSSVPLVAVLVYAELTREKYPRLYFTLHKPLYIWMLAALVVLWWIFRNVFSW